MKLRPTAIVVCLVAIMGLVTLHTLATGNGQTEPTKHTSSVKSVKSANKETKETSKIVTEPKEEITTEKLTEPPTEEPTEMESTEEFLLQTDNVDYNYHGQSVYLSESERVELAHLIMGEAGGEGFEGCCLLAQCVRDAMVYRGYDTISEVISGMSYYGYKYETCDDVEDAIDYIFVQGNSAVQHRILVMYASDLCEGGWHETQNFVYQHNYVRFFDMWKD